MPRNPTSPSPASPVSMELPEEIEAPPGSTALSRSIATLVAERDAALARVERLEKALAFYRDEWEADCDAVLIGPGVWDGGSVSHDPTEALRRDHGNRAAAALSEAPSQGDQ